MSNIHLKNSKNILMLIPELGYGGAEKSIIKLSHLLSEFHNVKMVVFKRNYNRGNYTQSTDEIRVPVIELDKKEKGKLGRWFNRWIELRRLKKDGDITISFLTGANMLNVATFTRSKSVVSMRGSRHFDPNFSKFKRWVYERLIDPITFRLSNKVVSISDGLTSEFSEHVGSETKKKLHTIELFVNSEDMISTSMSQIEDVVSNLKELPIVITAGRLSQEKGFQYLIKVFSSVVKSIPNAKLILIGDGPMYQDLLNLCETLKLSYSSELVSIENASVIFLGYRKDPYRYFKIAKVFVLSSLTEGFSNTILEALASGIPIVATNCPWGPRSILSKKPVDSKTAYPSIKPLQAEFGMLMPRIDLKIYHNAWVDVLVEILLNSVEDKDLVNRSHDRLRDFDVEVVGQKWLCLIDKV